MPLSLGEFGNALEALGTVLNDWPFGSVTMNPVVSVMGPLLLNGRVFKNPYLLAAMTQQLPEGELRAYANDLLRYVVLAQHVASSSTLIAYAFAHEWGHWASGSGDEGVAHAYACAFHPSNP